MSSSTSPQQRLFALVGALLFLSTAVAGGVYVIWQINQDNKNSKLVEQLKQQQQQQLDAAKDAVKLTCATDSSIKTNTTQEGQKMEGAQLANFTPVQTVDQLTCIDITVGEGQEALPGATVVAHYTGAVASTGTIFQSSHDSGQPIPFSLSGVIAGWTEGVPGMKVGGVRRLLIPAEKAYGANPPAGSGIPANAALVFDIELTGIQ